MSTGLRDSTKRCDTRGVIGDRAFGVWKVLRFPTKYGVVASAGVTGVACSFTSLGNDTGVMRDGVCTLCGLSICTGVHTLMSHRGEGAGVPGVPPPPCPVHTKDRRSKNASTSSLLRPNRLSLNFRMWGGRLRSLTAQQNSTPRLDG